MEPSNPFHPDHISLGQVETFLQTLFQQFEPEAEYSPTRGRPRVFPSMCLWAGMFVCLLRGYHGQTAIWRLISQRGLWFYPRPAITDQAIYKRLEQEGSAPLKELFRQVSRLMAERLTFLLESSAKKPLASFASCVVALDETKLDPIAKTLPKLRELSKGDKGLMPGKLASLFDIRLQQWIRIDHIANPDQNDKVHARAMIEELPPKSLILADMGYFSFAWFDELTVREHYFISRLRKKTTYEVQHIFYQGRDYLDAIIFLGAFRADKAEHAVRLVQFSLNGVQYTYITNVLDPQMLTIKQIAKLYARRWDIEMAFKLIKQHLKLHMLWSAKTEIIMQQVWACLTIAQVMHGMQMEIALRAGVDVFDVSLPLLIEYAPKIAYTGQDPIQHFVEQGVEARFIRPSRRIRIQTPTIEAQNIQPIPEGLSLQRPPRYAERRSTHRKSSK